MSGEGQRRTVTTGLSNTHQWDEEKKQCQKMFMRLVIVEREEDEHEECNGVSDEQS